ncbi:hypothetical protein GW17_00007733 [Ensete ventricosum]|nr:hypothetical protein GW17_00007733 [Ensete ventricosum]
MKKILTGGSFVDDLRDLAKGDTRAEASDAACNNMRYKQETGCVITVGMKRPEGLIDYSCRHRRSSRRGRSTMDRPPELGYGKRQELGLPEPPWSVAPWGSRSPSVATAEGSRDLLWMGTWLEELGLVDLELEEEPLVGYLIEDRSRN